jgi:hypothetical protein
MSNGIEWAPARKFPGYEVSKNHLVRNSKTKNIIPQRYNPYDSERLPKVTIIYRNNPTDVFVRELVKSAFGVGAK